MTKMVKCENCGANMNTDTDNAIRFCPFCGNAMKMPEDYIDLVKFQAKHNETVRQQMVKESIEYEKRDRKSTIITVICIAVVIAICGLVIAAVDPDMKCERIVNHVYQLINEGKYDEALLEAQKIRVDKEGLFDSRYDRWERQRNDIVKLIEQKKREAN